MNVILNGDALTMLKELPSETVDMCVTSPPYYGLRDYGCEGQIGLEPSPNEYVKRLVEVFREVRRVLVPEGTLWLNIADCYAGSGKGAWSSEKAKIINNKQSYKFTTDNPATKMPKLWNKIKSKDLIGIPWMLAFALRDDGWYLRSQIIWQKPNAMPESTKDRPTSSYEVVFLLAKSRAYYFDTDAIKEPVAVGTIERMKRGMSDHNKYVNGAPGQTPHTMNRPRKNRTGEELSLPTKRNCRDVWVISTKSYKSAHFATYPVELATRCILAGCRENGIVLDPFFGSGTTGIAAIENGRQYLGIEINPDYCRLSHERIVEAAHLKGVVIKAKLNYL